MHVGIMTGHFPRPSLGETLDAIRAHDMRHVQFNLSSAHLVGPLGEQTPATYQKIRAEFAKRDMTVAALGGPVNMVEVDPTKRQEGIERMRTRIEACEGLGTRVIATCTGSRHPDSMWRHHPDNQSEEAWRVLRQTLEELLPFAEEHDVALAFEPEVNNVANTAKRSRRLIDEMASPALKVVMDAANLFGKGDLPRMTEILDEAFDLLGEHVAMAHAKDLDRDGDAGHLAAGDGKLDYGRYVSLLCSLPFEVAVILHGLREDQVAGSVALLTGHAKAFAAERA